VSLAVQNLSKSYKGKKVVSDVSLEVVPGQVVGLLGPNGAGKTTTFFMMVGLVLPDSGEVLLEGTPLGEAPIFMRARMGLGYLPQDPSVFRKLTVLENLLLILDNLKISRTDKRARGERALSEFGISHLADHKANTLSGGERRRLEIARALVLEPKFLLLDEPFAGIDPLAIQEIRKIVLRLGAQGIGVVITDHNVRETLSTCDEAYLIRDGVIWMHGSPKDIVNNPSARQFYLGEEFTL